MDKVTPFIKAALDKDMTTMQSILATDSSAVNSVEEGTGKNAMHFIAKLGHRQYPPAEIPTYLIKSGIDINAKDKSGLTPLEISLQSGWQNIASLLLDNGVDRSVVTPSMKSKITCPDCKRVVSSYGL
mmetsp:Transcript_2074/g.2831  ORF Transcript_2074/g.2831 Transcript_2074/m.2831 type:complete len:128 (-) Transcript_2074:83-466(-)|eukprot:CAMPEP_0170075564 /NCGR_PEP_ID=MMETSP0019_2-20121128/12685_1 /TAXON_ID=98059 /ORGANISM="Dinobryon sp., Strain UTEXLB2267" /LENGTH=127 /DNA_ID=CAMNT_0010286627 /DNA_START=84 /DNA_END=467 /DNA_ORIENTATION=+